MAESRRMEFTTITQEGKKKPNEIPLTTHRFSLTLTNTTETTCPEFSFAELMKNVLKQLTEKGSVDSDDPFGEHDAAEQQKLEEIARAFEEKYAPRLKSKGGCDRLSDLVDLGDGYDETDQFIDNSEAYDELVPACMTTKLGGFYINSGHLDFKYISDESSEEFQVSNSVKKRRINRIDSDSESEEEPPKKGPQKRKFKDGVEVDRKRKKKLLVGLDGERIKVKRGRKPVDDKLKKKKTSPTVAELLKQQTASTSTSSQVVNGSGDDLDVGGKHIDRPATEKSSIESTFEAVLADAMGDDSGSHDGVDKKPCNPESIVPLPPDLPDSLTELIEQIKQEARETREGKCKFFSGNVNKMLLDIEIGSRQMAFSHRTTIFSHLSSFLPCSKETLIKRAKKLRLGQQNDQLKKPLRKLKEAVDNVMPLLQERYEAEHQKALQMRTESKEKGDGDTSVKDYASTESDDEDKPSQDATNKKRIMGPRKKFIWTENIRNCLCDVVRVKMQMFSVSKVRAQTAEEYLRAFLDAEVKPLWPQGWMQTRMLFKQSRSVHGNWTNQNKARKTLLTSKAASPTPCSIPINRDIVTKSSPVTSSIMKSSPVSSSIKKPKEVVEIVSSSGEDEKVANGPETDAECMNIEDYITSEDFDCLLSSIGAAEPQISMLLDYSDKTPVSTSVSSNNTSIVGSTTSSAVVEGTTASVTGGGSSTSGDTKVKSNSHVSQPKHSSVSTESGASSETQARNLVADMLQKPLPAKSKTTTSVQKTTAVAASNRESPFMAEFQKHLSQSSMVTTQEESHNNQATDLLSTSRLQSMLTSPLGSQSSKYQSSGSKQYEQFLKQQNYLQSDQRTQKVVSSQPSKSVSQLPGTQVNVIDSRVKVSDSGMAKVERGNVSSNSIDKEAMKQLHQRLLQMAGSGKMANIGKDSSGKMSNLVKDSSNVASSQLSDGRKIPHGMQKSQVDSSVVHQLFKQPLPASTATQVRLLPQQMKTVQSGSQKSPSSGKTDVPMYQSGTLNRQPTQAHQRVPNVGQSSGLMNRQPSPSHMSRTSVSPVSNRQSAASYVSVSSSTGNRQASVSQTHANSLLNSGGRQSAVPHGSPSKLSNSTVRISPSSRMAVTSHAVPTSRVSMTSHSPPSSRLAVTSHSTPTSRLAVTSHSTPTSRLAVTSHTSPMPRVTVSSHALPTSSNPSLMTQIREQSNSQSFLSKVIDSEMKSTLPQSTKVSPSRTGGQNKTQVAWQAGQADRMSHYNTVSSGSTAFPGNSLPGYLSVKLTSTPREAGQGSSYSVVSPALHQQQSSGSQNIHSQPAMAKPARHAPFGSQSGHSSPQVNQLQGQTTPGSQLQQQPQLPGLSPLYNSPHSLLSPSSPLYGLPPFKDSTHSSHTSHSY